MMLGDRNHVLGTSVLKQSRPCHRVKVFRLEHGNEIFISKCTLRPINGLVMDKFLAALLVHVMAIPLISESGDRIHAPVYEDSKLCIPVPLWHVICLERFPIGGKGTGMNDRIDVLENICSRAIMFPDGLLPSPVDSHRILFAGGSISDIISLTISPTGYRNRRTYCARHRKMPDRLFRQHITPSWIVLAAGHRRKYAQSQVRRTQWHKLH